MKYLHILALVMGTNAITALSLTRDEVIRFAAKFALVSALLFGVLPFLWGCSGSPTAPTSSRTFGWTAFPGCSPDLPIKAQRGEPIVAIKIPGQGTLQAIWETKEGTAMTVNFRTFDSHLWLVCSWTESGAK